MALATESKEFPIRIPRTHTFIANLVSELDQWPNMNHDSIASNNSYFQTWDGEMYEFLFSAEFISANISNGQGCEFLWQHGATRTISRALKCMAFSALRYTTQGYDININKITDDRLDIGQVRLLSLISNSRSLFVFILPVAQTENAQQQHKDNVQTANDISTKAQYQQCLDGIVVVHAVAHNRKLSDKINKVGNCIK